MSPRMINETGGIIMLKRRLSLLLTAVLLLTLLPAHVFASDAPGCPMPEIREWTIGESVQTPLYGSPDALAAAYCHYLQLDKPQQTKNYSNWKDFIKKNPNKVIK